MLSSPWWPLSFVFAALTAAGFAYAFRLARKGMNDAREGWRIAREQLDRLTPQATANVVELQITQAKLATALRELELARGNVRKLVPTASLAKGDTNTAGFVRSAFRAWICWFNDCPVVLPLPALLSTSELADDARIVLACEFYARAIMESALAQHLDGSNPRTDRAVLRQLADALGDDFAERVARDVELRGVVFSGEATPPPPASPAPDPKAAP